MFEQIKQKYNTIVIDPAWDITLQGKTNRRPNRRKKLPYDTMSLEEIKNIPISKIANKGSHIYLWATNKTLRNAFEVFDSWNINFHLVLVMAKPSGIAPCMGYVFATEFCLLGFYGKPMQKFLNIGKLNWFKHLNKHGEHSTKPDQFYELVENMSPSPRIDVFARKYRQNWDVFGNEIPNPIFPDTSHDKYLKKIDKRIFDELNAPKNLVLADTHNYRNTK